MRRVQHIAGFTLIELLLGIMISSMIISASYTAYLGATQAWDKGRVGSEQYQMGRVVLSLLEQHLRCALIPDEGGTVVFDGDFEYDGLEYGQTLQYLLFASTGEYVRSGVEMRSDLCEVKFYLKAQEEQGIQNEEEPTLYKLVMRKRRVPTGLYDDAESDEFVVIAERIVRLEFEYINETERLTEWVGEEGLPRAVDVTLVVAGVKGVRNPVTLSRLVVLNRADTSGMGMDVMPSEEMV